MSEVMKKLRLRERVGVHTEAHPTNPNLEVVVQPGQVFMGPERRAQRWPEKIEVMPDDMPISQDLYTRPRNAGPGTAPPPPDPKSRAEKVIETNAQKTARLADDMATIDAMTFDEIRKFAAGEAIDLGKSKTREDAIKVVKAAMSS